jgi:hypothetical protein
MFGMTIDTAKQGFFDRERVKRAMDRATFRVLSKFGAHVRQRAKTSIRKRKGISPPGQPPHSHTGLLRQFIFFAYDADRKSVVIGPTLLRSGSEVPRLLEYGGETTILKRGKPYRAHYRPRPYMRPAFEEEESNLTTLWRNTVR